jgi:hypothetical protein
VKSKTNIATIFLLYFLFSSSVCFAEDQKDKHIFSSWDIFEVDKCASIWLIKRFVDKDAVFIFSSKESFVLKGIAFDLPDADFRRYHNMSTYQSILKHYKLSDPTLVKIGKRIFDIEVNYWGEKLFDDSKLIEAEVKNIFIENRDHKIIVGKSLVYFDRLYEMYNK